MLLLYRRPLSLAVIAVFLSAAGAGELFSTATPPVHTRGVCRALAEHSPKHSEPSHTGLFSEQKLELFMPALRDHSKTVLLYFEIEH